MLTMINSISLAKNGSMDTLPLSLATVPWGILCGSLAIAVGFTPSQAQLMSLLVFAGAAQLASLTLIGAASSVLTIYSSTFVVSSRHLFYSAVFREEVKNKSFITRVMIAFFLTDEMFAVTSKYMQKHNHFNSLYSLASGITFYLIWNISTLLGIFLGELIPDLENYGFEFAIAATFIAIVIPSINNASVFITVLSSGISVLAIQQFNQDYALIGATIIGISFGYLSSIKSHEKQ